MVATYKRPQEVVRLLERLLELPDAPAEVIVVDGTEASNVEAAIRKVGDDHPLNYALTYVRSPKGLTLQRNVGVDISTKPFVFFLDDDALPAENYFTEMRRVFIEDRDKTIGAIGGCVYNEIDKPIVRRWRIRRAIGLVPRTPPYIYNDVGTSAPTGLLKAFSGIRDVDLFPGCAFAVRREVFDSTRFSGFFDGYSYGEDVEMALRIKQKWRVVCCGDARAAHYPMERAGGRPDAFRKGRMEVKNRYFIWRRHSPHASLMNRIRFHLDLFFLFVMDLVRFIARPSRGRYLSHACGLLAGAAACIISLPEWQEAPPTLRYRLAAEAPVYSQQ